MDNSNLMEDLDVMKNYLLDLSEEDRQKFREALSDESEIKLYDNLMNEEDNNNENVTGDPLEKFKNIALLYNSIDIDHLVTTPKQVDENDKFMKAYLTLTKKNKVSKEARVKLLSEVGMPKSTVSQLDKEFKSFIKHDKETLAREEKLSDLTTLLTLAKSLLSKMDTKRIEDLTKVLALSLRLTIDLRRKNYFEYFEIPSEKEEEIDWSSEIFSNYEKEKIREAKKTMILRKFKYNKTRYNVAKEGYRIPIKALPQKTHYSKWEKYFSNIENEFIDKDFRRMLDNNIISLIDYNSTKLDYHHINPIFFNHESRKDRLIVDCRELNKMIDLEKFTFENIDFVSSLIYSSNNYSTSIDLSDAYHSIHIHEESQKLLCIQFKKKIYKFHRLVFGLSIAPYTGCPR
uniref:Reverse transcriptase domain-containing protein n=1 Tax=Strongyloides stercoralis TaxID=6248 RepID=A0A0K0E4X7_STRER